MTVTCWWVIIEKARCRDDQGPQLYNIKIGKTRDFWSEMKSSVRKSSLVRITITTLFEPINFKKYLSDYQSPTWLAPDQKTVVTEPNYVTKISRVGVLMILFVVRQILWFRDDQCSWIEFGWIKIGFLPNWHFISISTYQINSFQPLLWRCEAQGRFWSMVMVNIGPRWVRLGLYKSI